MLGVAARLNARLVAGPANALPVFALGLRKPFVHSVSIRSTSHYQPACIAVLTGQNRTATRTPFMNVGTEKILQFLSGKTELRKAIPVTVQTWRARARFNAQGVFNLHGSRHMDFGTEDNGATIRQGFHHFTSIGDPKARNRDSALFYVFHPSTLFGDIRHRNLCLLSAGFERRFSRFGT